MLRIALRLLIAFALIAQGGFAAAAPLASVSSGHHCGSAMHHDRHASKCPCCPAKSLDMQCDDTCTTLVALPSPPVQFGPARIVALHRIAQVAVIAAMIDTPLRPPIA